MNKPTADQVAEALRDWVPAKRLTFADGWNYRGRPWTYGIRGAMVHHWAGVGDGGLTWMAARSGSYPFCNTAIRRGDYGGGKGEVVVLSALSAWHSGTGGPWARAGVPKDVAHLMVWGIEMEGPLKSTAWGVDDMTDEQWDSTARVICAVRQVAGPEAFPGWRRVIRHADWTDGTAGVSDTPLPTRGRKNDVWAPIDPIRARCAERWKKGTRKSGA